MHVTLLLNQVTSFPVSGISIVKPNTIRYRVSFWYRSNPIGFYDVTVLDIRKF